MPHYTLYKKEDHRRILFGSDNMLGCSFHGTYAAMGRFWYQIGTVTGPRRPTPMRDRSCASTTSCAA